MAVVGGGWAGCAAAVELSRKGHRVTLFEAARTLGGRARRVEIEGKVLDNGQHILLGAYAESLKLMRTVGINPDDALLRLPLQMRYPQACGGMDFVTPRLPAPFHMLVGLLRAKGLGRDDKLSLARFSTTARWMDWRMHTDCSVAELLDRFDQTDRLVSLMWRPLCIAALNTPPERASAQVFLNVLRDSLGARRAASDMLIPRVDLSELFPQQAAAFIQGHGGTVRCASTVKRVSSQDGHWRVEVNAQEFALDDEGRFDAVIIATQPAQAAILLNGLAETDNLSSFRYEPITTCYLQYAAEVRLEQPFFALLEDAAASEFGQFVFDRGQISADQQGLLAVVISASSEAIELGHQALAEGVAVQLATSFQRPELRNPAWTKVISEKRATFSCAPGLKRPDNRTAMNGLILAGDYTASDYPATLESAIRSGVQAAACLTP
ncbi:FAD-dependent oxidoreductase [Noviherbaspirillum cavernae]|uniref:FAD-dependent oxidoreductase n=1 Tax=Noviherbaspirillum cavernae TaxID=2320862 RepID=A0A418X669_9BURK|nr:FAD-dependent oxidoreductase [Noviherbaspirillum cavernae]